MVGHDCNAPATLKVGDAGIPIIDEGVTVHERKSGPLSLSRRAEATFPLVDNETEWYSFIDAYEEDGAMQKATISMQPVDLEGNVQTDREERLINGYVSAIGSRSGANKGRLTILGPYKLLSQIPAGNTFGANTPIREVLSWAMDTFEQGQPIFDDVSVEGGAVLDEEILETELSASDVRGARTGAQSWTAARDNVADVLKFVMDTADTRLWFHPEDDGSITLKAQRSLGDHYDATNDDGDVLPIFNDALYELRPFNTLTLKGKNYVADLGDLGVISTPVGQGNYVEATAQYDPLVERAGGNIAQQGESRFAEENAVEAHTRRELKRMLDDVSGGTIDAALAPQVHPYDTLDALPSCAGILNEDLPVLTYEVERTAHTLAPHDPGAEPQIPSSEIAVSIEIDPEKISSTVTKKRSQTAEGTKNRPVDSDPASDFTWSIF